MVNNYYDPKLYLVPRLSYDNSVFNPALQSLFNGFFLLMVERWFFTYP